MSLLIEQVSWSNPTFRSFVYWIGILCLRSLAVSFLNEFVHFITNLKNILIHMLEAIIWYEDLKRRQAIKYIEKFTFLYPYLMPLLIDQASWNNPIFRSFIFWIGILFLKPVTMSFLKIFITIYENIETHTMEVITWYDQISRRQVVDNTFINPEDASVLKKKVQTGNPNVERCRRAHRNDLENILIFLPIGFLYVLINPSETLAINLFRIVGIGRILHTIVYAVFVIPQPARLFAWLAPFLATGYMALQVICKVL